MASLSKKELSQFAKKLGKEEFDVSASVLVDILNHKYGGKSKGDNGEKTPFNFGDVQQYYLREKLPDKYSGVSIVMKEGPTGKYLRVYDKVLTENE